MQNQLDLTKLNGNYSGAEAKNDALQTRFKEQLATGKVVIIATSPSANTGQAMLWLAQARKLENGASNNEVAAVLQGWNVEKSILRASAPIKIAYANEAAKALGCNIELGATTDLLSIQVNENTTPNTWENHAGETVFQEPKKYPSSSAHADKKMVTTDDKLPIYRHTSLVFTEKLSDSFITNAEPEGAALEAAENAVAEDQEIAAN